MFEYIVVFSSRRRHTRCAVVTGVQRVLFRSWKIKGGTSVDVIQTDIGPIGVLICYDSEFPELGRRLVDEGARIIFVPFCTDNRQGYMRVRYCAQARAVENQCFVVMWGNVGDLPGFANLDVQYPDRKSVVWDKRGSVRVVLGGRCSITKKKQKKEKY